MLAQKTTQQSLRRLAGTPLFLSRTAAQHWASPTAIATLRAIQIRPATSIAPVTRIKPAESYKILADQRLHRPVAPHLTIYRPQITWILSSLNRITGVALSGGFYLFGLAYLFAPLTGWHLESASLAASFAAWPAALKVASKFLVALPFTFHSFNGVRHLVWDTGRELTNIKVIRTGWTVIGLTVVSSLYLALGH